MSDTINAGNQIVARRDFSNVGDYDASCWVTGTINGDGVDIVTKRKGADDADFFVEATLTAEEPRKIIEVQGEMEVALRSAANFTGPAEGSID